MLIANVRIWDHWGVEHIAVTYSTEDTNYTQHPYNGGPSVNQLRASSSMSSEIRLDPDERDPHETEEPSLLPVCPFIPRCSVLCLNSTARQREYIGK